VTGDDIGECIDVLAGLVLVMYAKPLKMLHQEKESRERAKIIRRNKDMQSNTRLYFSSGELAILGK
jgi:hypothetical protein